MNYLLSQLWICLSIASLLGGLIGWFLRGDNRSKLTEIENRWRSRFAELEYSNQALINRLKQGGTFENKYTKLQSRLIRMEKAADLASKQLRLKKESLSKMEQKLEHSNMKLLDKKSQMNELVTQLSDIESQQSNDLPEENHTTSSKHESFKNNDVPEIKTLSAQLQKKTKQYITVKERYQKLVRKADGYKASLIDAESKLNVTTKMLEDQADHFQPDNKLEFDKLKLELEMLKKQIKKQKSD